MNYNYKTGKKRIEEILDNNLKIKKVDKIPNEHSKEFTYDNAILGWVGSIFIDIRDSTTLFSIEDKEKVSKVIRAFSSEIIEILRGDDYLKEIGIRGDCVYAIYAAYTKTIIYDLADKCAIVNTYLKMLNRLLKSRELPEIKVGIGCSVNKDLVVKAGRKDTGINNNVWIGKAVVEASNLSGLGSKDGNKTICFSTLAYFNFIDKIKELNPEKYDDNWFDMKYSDKYNLNYYTTDLFKSKFSDWIKSGMPEEEE